MNVTIEWRWSDETTWRYLCTMKESAAPAALEELRGNADAQYRRRVMTDLKARSVFYRAV